ncbi:MAG: DUF2802 domain-containing protein [Gammaproteobacteria bacterium]
MILAGLYIVAIIGLSSLIISLVIWGLYLSFTKKTQTEVLNLNKQLDLIEQRIQGFAQGVIAACEKIQELEQRLKNFDARQEKFELRDPDSAAYTHAAKLVGMGAKIDDLINNCGISRAEAELIYIVNKNTTELNQSNQSKPLMAGIQNL